MARPRKAAFFEVMLPDTLIPANEWLYEYHRNSQTLVTYLTGNGAKSTAYYEAVKCLTMLREYLLDNDLSYSLENSEKWLNEAPLRSNNYGITLLRLHDIYQFGEIQPLHVFPFSVPYSKKLHTHWKTMLSIFASSMEGKSNSVYVQQLTTIAARFFYRIQENGLTDISQIDFEVLKNYCDNDPHKSHRADARYTYVIGNVLTLLAEKGYCRYGLGWYPYFRMTNHIIEITDLSSDQRNRIEEVRQISQEFSAHDYAVLIPDFLEEIKSFDYSSVIQTSCHFALYNLLLFLEMNDLGYHPVLSEIWLEFAKVRWQIKGWKMSRRILWLFNTFIEENAVIPQKIYREKALRYENLPEWCLEHVNPFLLQKQREGWEPSTICMYRTSVTRFCEYLVSKSLNSFQDLTPILIKDFNLADVHKTAEAKNAYNCRIRKFLQYLERKEAVARGISISLYSNAAPRESIVTILSDEEKDVINQFGSAAHTSIELRDYAIVMIGLFMGLRSIDIVQIKLSDIDWEKQSIRVLQEKTDYEIEVPMPTEVGNAIYRYIKYGRPKTDCLSLFVKNRAPYDSVVRAVCADALRRTLTLAKDVGFHITRRTFATDQLLNEVDQQTLTELMGHKDPSSLHRYLLHDEEKMRMCPISMAEAQIPFRGTLYD